MNNLKRKGVIKTTAQGLVILFLVMTCLRPVDCTAATPYEKPEKEIQITVLNIALFYAGLIGLVIGATTGWITLLQLSFEPKEGLQPAALEKK